MKEEELISMAINLVEYHDRTVREGEGIEERDNPVMVAKQFVQEGVAIVNYQGSSFHHQVVNVLRGNNRFHFRMIKTTP